jgi:hypothetical protein
MRARGEASGGVRDATNKEQESEMLQTRSMTTGQHDGFKTRSSATRLDIKKSTRHKMVLFTVCVCVCVCVCVYGVKEPLDHQCDSYAAPL